MPYYLKSNNRNEWHDVDDLTQGIFDNPITEEPSKIIGSIDLKTKVVFIDDDHLHLFVTRTPVESSNLKSVGYVNLRETLIIEFNNGSIYAYKNVPREKYVDLLEATSKGKYFYQRIKSKYPCIKVEDGK